jgi:hypothetical protein
MTRTSVFAALVVCACAAPVAAQPQTLQKSDIVTVTGCLTPGPDDTWFLTSATDPTVPVKGAPPPEGAPTTGKNRYRLIGLLEFNVPAHKGHTVTIKGLLIPADVRRLNITSVQHVAPACPPAAAQGKPKQH